MSLITEWFERCRDRLIRGSPEPPGLMMALDRGGHSRGVLYRLDATDLEATLGKLFRREFTSKPPNNMRRWITVESERGPPSALTFVMNRQSLAYVGKLADVPPNFHPAAGRASAGFTPPGVR